MKRLRLVAVLVVVAGLLVAVDLGSRAWAESRIATELRASLELETRPEVSLRGFPFLPNFAGGEVAEVTVAATGYRAEALEFERLDVLLKTVTFPPGRLLSGDTATIRARSGEGTVSLTSAAATAALQAQGVPLTVRFGGDRVQLTAERFGITVEGRVTLEDGALVFRPTRPELPVSFRLRLPERLLPGIRLTGLRIERNRALLDFHLTAPAFEIAPSRR